MRLCDYRSADAASIVGIWFAVTVSRKRKAPSSHQKQHFSNASALGATNPSKPFPLLYFQLRSKLVATSIEKQAEAGRWSLPWWWVLIRVVPVFETSAKEFDKLLPLMRTDAFRQLNIFYFCNTKMNNRRKSGNISSHTWDTPSRVKHGAVEGKYCIRLQRGRRCSEYWT